MFAKQNVIKGPPFSQIDLLSCRNLLIYLGPVLPKKRVPLFHYALKPNGVLALGSSETIGGFEELTTLNEELENRNADLDRALNDPNNFFMSVNIAIVMLCRNLRIRPYRTSGNKIERAVLTFIESPKT